ncbi:4Fe-4S dicluster domain-containing protein [candidate division WOR-3 bacterium]|nr:4Fe-4S dicluster domain-containing protein [candidate division WOR-3 bacterium]
MDNIIDKISDISGENIYACYQCGKCSAGCPSVEQMDILPNQVIRLIQIGRVELALKSSAIWVCASCFMCSVRCPRGIDLSKIMEALREIHLREDIDHIDIKDVRRKNVYELPQIALVANFRKQTG